MGNGKPGDTHIQDIVHHRLEVFGASVDALVREVDARIAPADRPAFEALVNRWTGDPDALFHRLLALRGGMAPVPLPAGRRPGSPSAALGLGAVGAGAGAAVGFLVYMIARATVLPTSLWSSDAVQWAIILGVAAVAAAAGWRQGMRPGRAGHAAMRFLLVMFPASIACGLVAMLLAGVIGELAGVSQMEGAFAMGVVFVIGPLGGVAGGVVVAAWAARRAWRGWDRPGP